MLKIQGGAGNTCRKLSHAPGYGLVMFPWLWLYAPQISWPLSGAVTEAISTDAFFRGIKPGAGVPAVEQQVFEQHRTASNWAG